MKIRVYYEDTDAGGIVYHTNYIKYCERARSERFFSQGHRPPEGDASGFVVHHISADFLAPAFLGEMLEVTSRVLALKRSSVILEQDIYRGSVKIFSMEITLAYLSESKVRRIPDSIRALLDIEGAF